MLDHIDVNAKRMDLTKAELPTLFQQIIHKTKYARWNQETSRRESWGETSARLCNFFHGHIQKHFNYDLGDIADTNTHLGKAFSTVYNLHSMPSMRCLMTAGPALEYDNICGFNCCYRVIDCIESFPEIMYILMCGTGVGFSVERQFTGYLPMIPMKLRTSDEVIVVEDSREGWAKAFHQLLYYLYEGIIPQWNTSKIRKKGARLKTMGGFASGPEPLEELFKFTVERFKQARGRRLNSLDCHDIVCMIGDCVVSGGVRRSALISLSNPSDLRMREAKTGNWYNVAPWRALANNSACYTERPEVGFFMAEWLALYLSHSGERGIFNRAAAIEKCRKIGRLGLIEEWPNLGTNPCAEILLRSQEPCNLSEIVARSTDNVDTLIRKASAAAMFGTWQSTLTNYKYIGEGWRNNAEEERLLGVSITGIMDHPILSNRNHPDFGSTIRRMREEVVATNHRWADILGIPQSAAMTCIKPSGTVSLLVNSAPGIHSQPASFYKRRIILDNKDPVCQFLQHAGLVHEPSAYKPDLQTVFTFPMRSPSTKKYAERTAIDQLEQWKAFNEQWADHSVSCTINVNNQEWPEVGSWVWQNFDNVTGLSFLPTSDVVYKQLPREVCTEREVVELENQLPQRIDWTQLSNYEKDDTTQITKEFACVAGADNCG